MSSTLLSLSSISAVPSPEAPFGLTSSCTTAEAICNSIPSWSLRFLLRRPIPARPTTLKTARQPSVRGSCCGGAEVVGVFEVGGVLVRELPRECGRDMARWSGCALVAEEFVGREAETPPCSESEKENVGKGVDCTI